MTNTERPKGRRFSHVYMDRPINVRDAARVRRRLYALFNTALSNGGYEGLAHHFELEIGVPVEPLGNEIYDFEGFFDSAPLDALLDSITVLSKYLSGQGRLVQSAMWRKGCERIFREEQTAYSLDDDGGVHLLVDAEFQRTRATAIEALKGTRYAAAANLLARAYEFIDGVTPQPREAFKSAFDSVETLFKLMSGLPRIGTKEAKEALEPLLAALYPSDATALLASKKMVRALGEWVDASHVYRHGPAATGSSEPPEEIWHLLMSQAAAYVRWLAELDRIIQRASNP